MYKYPYGNYSQLNLNWIINKIKALEDLIGSGGAGGADLAEVANALISASYSSLQAYQVNDIVYDTKTEKLYRCNTAIPAGGEVWNPSHWDQILIGPTVANLVRAVAYMDSDHVFNESDVDGLHVTEALNALKTAVNSVADIAGNGVLAGFTATDLTGAANELKGALTNYANLSRNTEIIPDSTDYNNIKTSGSFRCSTQNSAQTMLNLPFKRAHTMWVVHLAGSGDSHAVMQILFYNYATFPLIYARSCNTSGEWSEWRNIALISYSDNLTAGTTGQTFTHPTIRQESDILNTVFSNPENVGSDVVFTPADGAITITGTFYGNTNVKYYTY